MMRRSLRLALLTLTLAAIGCSKPQPVELTPRSVQVVAIQPDGVQLALALAAHNPNSFPIIANSVSAAFELPDGTELGRGASTTSFTIPAKGDQDISAQLEVHFSSMSALAPYALNMKPLPYRLRGTARLGTEHVNLDVPFTVEGALTPQQLIGASLNGAQRLFAPPPH